MTSRIALGCVVALACKGNAPPAVSAPGRDAAASRGSTAAPTAAPAAPTGAAATIDGAAAPIDAAAAPTGADAMPVPAASVDETDEVVIARAFDGKPPELPLLAADGNHAAVNASSGLGESSFGSYEVGVLDLAGHVEHLVVIDKRLAKARLEDGSRPDGKPPLAMPTAKLHAAATVITGRLAGFTPFAHQFMGDDIPRGTGTVALDGAQLAYVESDTAGMKLTLTDPAGKVVVARTLPVIPRQFRDRDGGRCGGPPRLGAVWSDPTRKRALLEIGHLGHDSCEDEPLSWLLWKLP